LWRLGGALAGLGRKIDLGQLMLFIGLKAVGRCVIIFIAIQVNEIQGEFACAQTRPPLGPSLPKWARSGRWGTLAAWWCHYFQGAKLSLSA